MQPKRRKLFPTDRQTRGGLRPDWCTGYLGHPFQIQRELGLISPAVPGILPGKERIKEQEANRNGKVFERMIQVANTAGGSG
jgi:hypothetical protein